MFFPRFFSAATAAAVLLPAALFAQARPGAPLPIDDVNMLLGTSADGQTFPAAGVPFAMTEWAPQTREGEVKCVAPYYFEDTRIQGFRGSHFLSGSCAQDYGSFTVMPLLDASKLQAKERSSAFSHSRETATPYLYAVDLADTGIHAEVTGTTHAGMMRFRFPAGTRQGVIAFENNVRLGQGTLTMDPDRGEIRGSNPVYRIYAGAGTPAGFSGYAVLQIDRPFHIGGTWSGADRQPGAHSLTNTGGTPGTSGTNPGAYVTVDLPADGVVQVRIGTSFTSLDEARRNLQAEISGWNFDAVVQQAKAAWTKRLGTFDIGGNDARRRVFYSALYHASLLPRVFSDVSGTYPRFAGGQTIEHADGWQYYDDYSAWDIFRAELPLFTIIDPARESDIVHSLLAKGQQGGFLPIFPAWNSYTSEMIGDHTTAIIADAYVKGIRGFDAEQAYQLMRKNALVIPPPAEYKQGRGRRALDSYEEYGYIPLEDPVKDAFHDAEQVSRTLEYAYDDYVVSVMAQALGHADDAALFRKRAQNYRNVIDPATGFARGRHADGSWDKPFDPAGNYRYITEGLPYQYTFFAPQDVPGLIQATGGREAFVAKLDGLFAGNYYNHGNEPSHHIAYLYDLAGEPAKTELHIHQIMAANYHDGPDGLSGNDDAGQMSAWYILSALGFYPVTPGTPRYEIGTPQFDDVTVHLPNGKALRILAPGAEAGKFYIRSIRWNGKPLGRMYLLHSEIAAGGTLAFTMAGTP